MPTPADQLPAGRDWIARALAGIRREIRELRAARRLEAATIGAGGLSIAGGALRMTTPSGAVIWYIGALTQPHLDGSPQQGVVMSREDGSLVLGIGGVPDQAWSLWDRAGNIILAEDTNSGQGLARPYLEIPWAAARYTDWPSTTSGSYTDIQRATFPKQSPYATVQISATSTVSGTTGNIQLTINGAPWGTPIPVTFSITTQNIGPFPLPGNHLATVELRLQAQRTAGTGSIAAAVVASNTMQS